MTSRTTPSRRTFLASSALAAGAAAASRHLPARAAIIRPRVEAKKILILGGTGFLGPAIVRHALARGHTMTLFNRGRTNPHLFPDVEKLRGQRRRPNPKRPGSPAQDLKALEGRKWDAVIDTSAYFTGEVEDVAKVLGDNVGQYLFVSSLSVYPQLGQDDQPITEASELAECEDKYRFDMGKDLAHYGALKRYCEDAARAAFPDGATLVRPGYIVGPGDPSDRFTYWPARFDRGGEILAPGTPDNDLQFVDVRDLGEWIVHLIEQRTTGAFNAVGFGGSLTVEEFLHTGKGTRNLDCSFTWVDDEFLEANDVSSWGEMGCWTPKAKNGHTDNRKAIAAGAKFRPIADTIRDTADWVKNERGERPWRAGMKAEREAKLLAQWHKR
ncbi:MAG: NAD-dependent epimerase/dehydratase family protein [bacterium]|nr:NAD-dependent epimerase/dehydratase family protein [bacterium]